MIIIQLSLQRIYTKTFSLKVILCTIASLRKNNRTESSLSNYAVISQGGKTKNYEQNIIHPNDK